MIINAADGFVGFFLLSWQRRDPSHQLARKYASWWATIYQSTIHCNSPPVFNNQLKILLF